MQNALCDSATWSVTSIVEALVYSTLKNPIIVMSQYLRLVFKHGIHNADAIINLQFGYACNLFLAELLQTQAEGI